MLLRDKLKEYINDFLKETRLDDHSKEKSTFSYKFFFDIERIKEKNRLRKQIYILQFKINEAEDDVNLIDILWDAINDDKISDRIFKIKLLQMLCVFFEIEKETYAKIQHEIGEKTKNIMGPAALTVIHNCQFAIRYDAIHKLLRLTQTPRRYAVN